MVGNKNVLAPCKPHPNPPLEDKGREQKLIALPLLRVGNKNVLAPPPAKGEAGRGFPLKKGKNKLLTVTLWIITLPVPRITTHGF
jgi:hypothetical protein